ncbi:hypothetical protein prwr041_03320 [Prevotella herbatica]|uniref:Major fimbrial subunit protein N-terminal domain-containing protein n=1 Tax=Prevotella herbatica TaxID=2801997 RepID=A0ABN6EH79_9BACT|nr:fimbrial protein [Prevotella herbatica]BCS84439.1 hypothetical protein prwr041_03320 [Prevotella herbatica]
MKLTYFFISGLAMTIMMSSCSSENDTVTTDNGLKTISLDFSATNLKTRASGNPADANGYIVGLDSKEARLSRLAVGIFNGTTTSSINEITLDNTKAGDDNTSYTASFNAQAAANNNVYIVANAPVGHFSGKTLLSDFYTTALDLGYTTSVDGNTNYTSGAATKQVQTALPMNSPLATLTAGSGADINKLVVTGGIAMKRLVARIAINSIKISIPSTGMYAGDTFTPTEVFVYNAATSINPDGTTLSTEPSNSGESTKTSDGWTPGTTMPTIEDNLGNYSYLSTGVISSFTDNTQSSPTLATTNQYYFYVFPHTATTPTKLVIKGIWHNSATSTYEVVYYPIVINHSQTGTTITDGSHNPLTPATDSQIDANMQYNISAEIYAKGVSDPATNITPSAISVALTVTDWSVTNQNVVFE